MGCFGFVGVFVCFCFKVETCSTCRIILLSLLSLYFFLPFHFVLCIHCYVFFFSLLSCALLLASIVSPLHCK